ncbi:MAG: glycosyltransferase, partial [Candidatus Eiseniibacteriota bacterium]
MILAYVGGYDPAYPRNAVLRRGLTRLGVEVKSLFVPQRAGFLERSGAILVAVGRLDPAPDVVLVAEFCHKDIPAAWLAARRAGALLAADPLISRADTLVADWGLYGTRSLDGWACRRWDEVAFGWPKVVVADTRAHAQRYAAWVGRDPFPIVHVGATDDFFDVPDDEPAPSPLRVLYAGGFLPLHGVDVIAGAAERLHARGERGIEIECVGDGIQYREIRERAVKAGLSNVRFVGRRPLDELPGRMGRAHVVLGVFQKDGEGERVLPNKVVQGLATGRCVVTGDTEAARELLIANENAMLVPPGDSDALADALLRLRDEPAHRRRVATQGRALARRALTAEATARQLLVALGGRTIPAAAPAHETARAAAAAKS